LQPATSPSLAVIGDSVTAGMGGGDFSEKWPRILAREHELSIQDYSHAGATTASALTSLEDQRITAPIVFLEIGGNDLLGSTDPQQFDADLDALLRRVTRGDRQVLMLELPLPPFRQAFGHVQRRLADKYDVALVPKRVFLSVLAAPDATVDTIHLSASGHQRMAKVVWQLVEPAFSQGEPHAG
jgi:lysophospholipase L1-like esterase